MKRMLQVVVCAFVIALTAAGCGGSSNTPKPPGGDSNAAAVVQDLVKKATDKKARSSARGAAIISLGRFGAEAQSALPDLEKIVATEKDKTLKEKATQAIKRIKGEE